MEVAFQVAVGVGTGITPVALAGKASCIGGPAIIEGILVRAHDAGVGKGFGGSPLGVLVLVGKRAVLVAVTVLLGALMDLESGSSSHALKSQDDISL